MKVYEFTTDCYHYGQQFKDLVNIFAVDIEGALLNFGQYYKGLQSDYGSGNVGCWVLESVSSVEEE